MSKEVKKLRGTARFFEDESFDFTPQQKKETPVQRDVMKVRKSSFYQTNGEKESSMVMHLNVPANTTDPVAELTEDFDKLMKKISPKAGKKLSGKKIMDNGATTVTVNMKQHLMQVDINIDLQQNPHFKDFLYQQVFDIIRCFISNQALIASAFPSPEKSGTKS